MAKMSKETLGLLIFITVAFLALCVVFYLAQGLSPWIRDATTSLAGAMIGGVAAGVYINYIGRNPQKSE